MESAKRTGRASGVGEEEVLAISLREVQEVNARRLKRLRIRIIITSS